MACATKAWPVFHACECESLTYLFSIVAISFYNSKNFNCIGALSFHDWKRSFIKDFFLPEVLFVQAAFWPNCESE